MSTFNSISRRQFSAAVIAGLASLGAAPLALADQKPAEELPESVEVQFPVTVDDQGREVVVESIERVVTVMGSFAKLWELAGGTLTGVTDDTYTSYGIDKDVQSVGSYTAPNLESIIALEPTLVIMSAASTSARANTSTAADLVTPLEEAGIPVLTFGVTVFADYLRMLRACCDLTGREDLYKLNGTDVEGRIQKIVVDCAQLKGEDGPTALLIITYSGGIRVQAETTQSGAILADLGARNLAAMNRSLLKDFSMESVLEMDPDFIFVVAMGDDAEAAKKALAEQTENDPAWAALTAVNEGRCIMLDPAISLYKPLNEWEGAYAAFANYLDGYEVAGDAE